METQIKGLRIHYIVQGSGPDLLFLHGWGAPVDLYKGLLAHLAQTHTVYALDMPGVGKSDEPDKPWCVDDFVEVTEEFIRQMGPKELVLFGHSFGGRQIIKMTTKENPVCRYTKLILMDAAGIRQKKTLKARIRTRKYKIAKAIFSTRLMHYLYPDYLDNMRKRIGSADYNAASPVMRGTLVRVVNEDLTPLLDKIMVPALLIWGENDTATPLRDGLLMEKRIKDAGLVVVKGGSHFSYLDAPGLVYSCVDAFLSGKEA